MALMTLKEYAKLNNIGHMNMAERAKFCPLRVDPIKRGKLELYEYSEIVAWHKRIIDTRKFLN